ncbi:MAG: hypothetical protein KF784_12700 [Fimbriimonadaceae bacterium]|nr:hypothetical protein [Fimbriimonadaceae bacterium]
MKNTMLMICAVLPAVSFGQNLAQDKPTILTDRPAFTDSAAVVPLRWLQIESGLTYQRIPGGSVVNGPEALLRYG